MAVEHVTAGFTPSGMAAEGQLEPSARACANDPDAPEAAVCRSPCAHLFICLPESHARWSDPPIRATDIRDAPVGRFCARVKWPRTCERPHCALSRCVHRRTAAGVNSQKNRPFRVGGRFGRAKALIGGEMPTGVVGLLGTVFVGNSEL